MHKAWEVHAPVYELPKPGTTYRTQEPSVFPKLVKGLFLDYSWLCVVSRAWNKLQTSQKRKGSSNWEVGRFRQRSRVCQFSYILLPSRPDASPKKYIGPWPTVFKECLTKCKVDLLKSTVTIDSEGRCTHGFLPAMLVHLMTACMFEDSSWRQSPVTKSPEQHQNFVNSHRTNQTKRKSN